MQGSISILLLIRFIDFEESCLWKERGVNPQTLPGFWIHGGYPESTPQKISQQQHKKIKMGLPYHNIEKRCAKNDFLTKSGVIRQIVEKNKVRVTPKNKKMG